MVHSTVKAIVAPTILVSTGPSAYPPVYLPLYLFTYLGNLSPVGIYPNTRIYVVQEKLEKDAQRARRRNDDVGDFCILASTGPVQVFKI